MSEKKAEDRKEAFWGSFKRAVLDQGVEAARSGDYVRWAQMFARSAHGRLRERGRERGSGRLDLADMREIALLYSIRIPGGKKRLFSYGDLGGLYNVKRQQIERVINSGAPRPKGNAEMKLSPEQIALLGLARDAITGAPIFKIADIAHRAGRNEGIIREILRKHGVKRARVPARNALRNSLILQYGRMKSGGKYTFSPQRIAKIVGSKLGAEVLPRHVDNTLLGFGIRHRRPRVMKPK